MPKRRFARQEGGDFMYRIGYGYDVHQLAPGRKLVLGGVTVANERGLAGHSDADVAAHALIDAILGALALGDIGTLFPDSDPVYAGADSLFLLSRVMSLPAVAACEVVNCDLTIIAETPKIAPIRDKMRENFARALNCHPGRVSVKGTTTEKLGFTGRGEGIAAAAAVLLRKRELSTTPAAAEA